MKTISRIIMIVLVTTVVAAVFSLAVNNGSIASGSNASEQPPVGPATVNPRINQQLASKEATGLPDPLHADSLESLARLRS